MSHVSTQGFKNGLKFLNEDKQPCSIIENEIVKPGKGQAFNRVKFRNLITGRMLEKTFKSGEKVELADIMELEMQFLYSDGDDFVFMDQSSFEQYTISKEVAKDMVKWMIEGVNYTVTLWNSQAIVVVPPKQITMEVSNTEPGLKGDTATGATKPATLSTGGVIQVPLFVEIGQKIIINTVSGEYLSRAKE